MIQKSHCLYCQQAINSADCYCTNCGQSAHIHRLSIGHLMHELMHFFTHADKGIFFLIKLLATQPRKTACLYIDGRERKYVVP